MKDIIDWLIKAEEMAFSAYSKAADYFHSDTELGQLIRQLADDEKVHHAIILQVDELVEEKPAPPSGIGLISEDTKQYFEDCMSEIEKRIATGTLTKNDMVDFIVSLEFCEWNDVFTYIVNKMKHDYAGFRTVAVNMHHHRKIIEKYISAHEELRRHHDRISHLPETWEEKILVVDDEPVITDVIESILSNEGLIDIATNGKIAFEKVREKYYAVIISDINMPVMDGIAFYKKAVELYPSIKKRFLFFSGRLDRKTSDFLKENGLISLQKPSNIQDIRNTVIKILTTLQ